MSRLFLALGDRGVTAALLLSAGLLGIGIVASGGLIAVGLFALLVFIAGVRFPSLLAAVCFCAVWTDQAGGLGVQFLGIPMTASKLTVLALMAAWVLHAIYYHKPLLRWHPVGWGLLLLFAAALASLAVAGRPTQYGLNETSGMLFLCVFVLVVYTVIPTDHLPLIFRLMAIVMILTVLYDIVAGTAPAMTGTPEESERAAGTFGNANEWAALLLLIGPICVGGLVNDDSQVSRWLALGAMVAVPLGILMSQSRGAFIAFVSQLPLLFYLLRSQKRRLIMALVGLMLAAPFTLDFDELMDRYATLLDPSSEADRNQGTSLEVRSILLQEGIDVFKDNWLIGVGTGNIGRQMNYVSLKGTYRAVHNTYVHIAAQQGVVGLLALALFAGLVARTLWVALRAAGDHRSRDMVLGAATSTWGIALMAATADLITMAMAYYVLGVTLVVTRSALESAEPAEPLGDAALASR